MLLANGTILGPYEVLSPLGAGGMGEVYRARDMRLDRIVALKILPPTLSRNPDLRTRFEREARAISAIAHPHICALYDIGHVDGTDYLVMEYIEGESLADRIARGPLPLSQVLRYGAEIAQALHTAHRRGVIHRDLKPGNVMITASGAKLLDFGLAQMAQPAMRMFSDSSAPATVVNPITAEGTIVGTFQYMSPEQLEGKPVDARSDIFSLGIVLHEMATAQRPFQGSSPVSVMAAILSADPPPVSSIVPAAPPALDRTIATALQKDPEDRWQTAQDVARQLHWIRDGSATSGAIAPPPRTRWYTTAIAIAVGALLIAGGTWLATRYFAGARSRIEAVHLDLTPPAGTKIVSAFDMVPFAIAPDGRTIAFVAWRGDSQSLFLRRLDSPDVRAVSGSDGASAPFWSSDAQWVGFSARGKLWKIRADGGGTPAAIVDLRSVGARASWVGETILFSDRPGGRTDLYRIGPAGGEAVKVSTPDAATKEWYRTWPQLLADGSHFTYHSMLTNTPERRLMLGAIGSSQRVLLASGVSDSRVIGSDLVLYVRDGKLLSQRIDADRGTILDEPTLIVENVAYFAPTARAEFDVSQNGVLVYRTETSTGRVVVMDRKGTEIRVLDARGPFFNLAISPDGKRAAVSVITRETGAADIWIYDMITGLRDRFTTEGGTEVSPLWMRDGRTIIYSTAQGQMPYLVRRQLSAAESQQLLRPGTLQTAGSLSADGKYLYYSQLNPSRRGDVLRVSLATPDHPEPILATSFDENDPHLSPDEAWLAFTSDATGAQEVYLQNLASGDRIRVSTQGGSMPRWSRNPPELFFISAGKTIVSVTPRANEWHDATTTPLFDGKNEIHGFDVTPDGLSFLLSEWTAGPTDDLIHVVIGALPER